MALHYPDLDRAVRDAMIAEFEMDHARSALYISPRLTPSGVAQWPGLLRAAAAAESDGWLARQLVLQRLLRSDEPRRRPDGSILSVKVRHDASDVLAEGQFNSLYARGLCVVVLAEGGLEVEVCRGKSVEIPRARSAALVGTRLPAARLLASLRAAHGLDAALGVPGGPGSGITVRRTCS